MLKKTLFISLSLAVGCLLFASGSKAVELQSPRFKIDLQELNINYSNNKPVIFTLESIYGSKAQQDFNDAGVFNASPDADQLTITVNTNSLLIPLSTDSFSGSKPILIMVNSDSGRNFFTTLSQEYDLKNLSGRTLPLFFSLAKSGSFLPLSNQNKAQNPSLILSSVSVQPVTLYFKSGFLQAGSESTYETIVDIINAPSY